MANLLMKTYTRVGDQTEGGVYTRGDDPTWVKGNNPPNASDHKFYKNYGADYFGLYTFRFRFKNHTDGDGPYVVWALANDINNPITWEGTSEPAIYLYGIGKDTLCLKCSENNDFDEWTGLLTETFEYWITINRATSTTITCEIKDHTDTTVITTLSITIPTSPHSHHIAGSTYEGGLGYGRWRIANQTLTGVVPGTPSPDEFEMQPQDSGQPTITALSYYESRDSSGNLIQQWPLTEWLGTLTQGIGGGAIYWAMDFQGNLLWPNAWVMPADVGGVGAFAVYWALGFDGSLIWPDPWAGQSYSETGAWAKYHAMDTQWNMIWPIPEDYVTPLAEEVPPAYVGGMTSSSASDAIGENGALIWPNAWPGEGEGSNPFLHYANYYAMTSGRTLIWPDPEDFTGVSMLADLPFGLTGGSDYEAYDWAMNPIYPF